MSQSRQVMEKLIRQGRLPIKHADQAAQQLAVYPTKNTWLHFFDKALLIIGSVALVLSLVFFVAYNWLHMGKMGKFALVEGLLVITVGLYVLFSFRKRFALIRQLLLLTASIITGSFLALVGQVYQTGADTWQLFALWALLITPWVVIARLPALWLLWLGLINVALLLYFEVSGLAGIPYFYQSLVNLGLLALLNTLALNGWLRFTPKHSSLSWSSYVVGLVSAVYITCLAIMPVLDDYGVITAIVALLLWASWCGLMWWRFYQSRLNVLMLTYLCGSVIVTVMFWVGELLGELAAGGFLLLALLLIAMSSMAVHWLRGLVRLNHADTHADTQGAPHE